MRPQVAVGVGEVPNGGRAKCGHQPRGALLRRPVPNGGPATMRQAVAGGVGRIPPTTGGIRNWGSIKAAALQRLASLKDRGRPPE